MFSYTRVPANQPRAGVRITDLGDGMSAHVAGPVRAIADLVYTRSEVRWKENGKGFVTESLRMEWDDLRDLNASEFEEVIQAIRNKRTLGFVEGLRKALER